MRWVGVSIALIFWRICAVTFSRAAARSPSGMSRMAANCGRSSAWMASSWVCCSALKPSSVTKRSRCAAKPPPPACWATASLIQLNRATFAPASAPTLPVLLPVAAPDAPRAGPEVPCAGPEAPCAGPEAPCPAGSTPATRTRSAALGIFSTFSRRSVTRRTLAVMPGKSLSPTLVKPTTAT